MQKLLDEFDAVCVNRPFELAEAHADGKKLIEYTGKYVPQEILYAGGVNYYPMWRGGEPEPPDAVLDETVRFLNPYDRTPYGLIKLGLDPVAEEADIYAYSHTECHNYRIAELVERAGYPVCKVGVPTDWLDDDDLDYYSKKVRDLVVRMEIVTGRPLTQAWLAEGIEKYNTIRDLLRQIDEYRKADVPPISGSEFERLNHNCMLVEPDVAIGYLKRILEACASAPTEGAKKPRIVVFGHAIAHGDYIVVRAFERAGAEIVHEIMDDAWFDYQVDVETEGDLYDNIIRNRYRDALPNDNMQPSWPQRRAALLDAVADYRADGVLWYDLLYDEIYDMEYACMADELGKLGIPLLRISTSYEYTREAMGPLNTRIETFVATLQGGR